MENFPFTPKHFQKHVNLTFDRYFIGVITVVDHEFSVQLIIVWYICKCLF